MIILFFSHVWGNNDYQWAVTSLESVDGEFLKLDATSGESNEDRAGMRLDISDVLKADVIVAFISSIALSDDCFREDLDSIIKLASTQDKLFIPVMLDSPVPNEFTRPIFLMLNKLRSYLEVGDINAANIKNSKKRLYEILKNANDSLTKAEIKENIESNAPQFIHEAEDRLNSRAKELKEKAQNYFVGAYIIIVLSLITAGIYFWGNYDELSKIQINGNL